LQLSRYLLDFNTQYFQTVTKGRSAKADVASDLWNKLPEGVKQRSRERRNKSSGSSGGRGRSGSTSGSTGSNIITNKGGSTEACSTTNNAASSKQSGDRDLTIASESLSVSFLNWAKLVKQRLWVFVTATYSKTFNKRDSDHHHDIDIVIDESEIMIHES
jgi:hypothetical protein